MAEEQKIPIQKVKLCGTLHTTKQAVSIVRDIALLVFIFLIIYLIFNIKGTILG
jgi:hypothetical protein